MSKFHVLNVFIFLLINFKFEKSFILKIINKKCEVIYIGLGKTRTKELGKLES